MSRIVCIAVLSLATLASAAFPQTFRSELESQGLGEGGWPRVARVEGHELILYQPQVDSWQDYEIMDMMVAIAVALDGQDQYEYGAAQLIAKTHVDLSQNNVIVYDIECQEVWFPTVMGERKERIEAVVRGVVPKGALDVALERILANLERTKQRQQREVLPKYTPPPIFRSDTPAILVQFLGTPKFQNVPGTELGFAINTNWDVFHSEKTNEYFLIYGKGWLVTEDPLEGPWEIAKKLPADFAKLPDDENWADVRDRVPGVRLKEAPKVFTSQRPSELILSDGPLRFDPIPTTKLSFAMNTEADIFRHQTDGLYYYRVAGRWFRAATLDGPWYPAPITLPVDFREIPRNHAAAEVLASVAGTPEADMAMLLSSIPRKAAVDRREVKITVAYAGAPEFSPIQGANGVEVAVNSPDDVFRVEKRIYCCRAGIWFVSLLPKGPFTPCDRVPEPIYSIPVSSPWHPVTYVNIHESDEDTVIVGYTAGYEGAYISRGSVVFGSGAWIEEEDWPEIWRVDGRPGYAARSSWFSYGCAAQYSYFDGTFIRRGEGYGPWGGGEVSILDPASGRYIRGPYAHGPIKADPVLLAHSPYTAEVGLTKRVRLPQASYTAGVVLEDDGPLRPASMLDGEIPMSREEGRALADARRRSELRLARKLENDVYVGRDRTIYRRTQQGNFFHFENDGWRALNVGGGGPGTVWNPGTSWADGAVNPQDYYSRRYVPVGGWGRGFGGGNGGGGGGGNGGGGGGGGN